MTTIIAVMNDMAYRVLALRGRLREVPWYSFFTWGYKAPREWWTSFWYEGKEYVTPTALVDLSGIAELKGIKRVGNAIVIGALTRHVEVANSAEVKAATLARSLP